MFGNRRTYLDYAAGISGNPSSPHEEGRQAKKKLEDARRVIARLLEAQADDIIFTGGATEANALAILGHVQAILGSGVRDIHIMYLPSSHASLVRNARMLEARGVAVEALPIKDGRVDIPALTKMLRPETALVSMDAVCGETGVIWNTREVAHALAETGRKILLHVDASQAPLTEKLSRSHFGADMLALDLSKVSPVRGMGALVAHRTIPLKALYEGGGQERGLRSGSESPELARELAAALSAAAKDREQFRARAQQDRTACIDAITKAIPSVLINEGKTQAPNILNISLPGRDTDYLVALLDEAGFAVSTKSACETDSEEGSRAVFALFGDQSRARATLRISWGPATASRELHKCVEALRTAVAFIDSAGRK